MRWLPLPLIVAVLSGFASSENGSNRLEHPVPVNVTVENTVLIDSAQLQFISLPSGKNAVAAIIKTPPFENVGFVQNLHIECEMRGPAQRIESTSELQVVAKPKRSDLIVSKVVPSRCNNFCLGRDCYSILDVDGACEYHVHFILDASEPWQQAHESRSIVFHAQVRESKRYGFSEDNNVAVGVPTSL